MKHRNRNKSKNNHRAGETRHDKLEKIKQAELRDAQRGNYDEDDYDFSVDPLMAKIEEQESLENPAQAGGPRRIYVLDTNVLISCVDLIYDPQDEGWREVDVRPHFDNAHLVIPMIVIYELDYLKSEQSLRGLRARVVLEHIKHLVENKGRTIADGVKMDNPIEVGYKNQVISILPLPKDFAKILPWIPEAGDNDGWIAVTTLYATLITHDFDWVNFNRTSLDKLVVENVNPKVTLVTNDNDLIIKASALSVRTCNFYYKQREPYTGCRWLTVPDKLFNEFYYMREVPLQDFQRYMPKERDLIANEFLYLRPASGVYPNTFSIDEPLYPDIARYDKRSNKLVRLTNERYAPSHPDSNYGIATLHDSLCNRAISVVIVDGAAGTGKTYTTVEWAIDAIRSGQYKKCVIITSRSSKLPTGALPGGLEEKIRPIVSYVYDAVESFVSSLPEFREMRALLRKYGDSGFSYSYEKQLENSANEQCQPDRKSRKGKQKESKPYYNKNLSASQIALLEEETGFVRPSDFGEEHSKGKKKKGGQQNQPETHDSKTYDQRLREAVEYYIRRYFEIAPYEFMMDGRSIKDSIIIFDEAQRVPTSEAITISSRQGARCKYIYLGDVKQISHSDEHKVYENCLERAKRAFVDWEGCSMHRLDKQMRSEAAGIATREIDDRKIARLLGTL